MGVGEPRGPDRIGRGVRLGRSRRLFPSPGPPMVFRARWFPLAFAIGAGTLAAQSAARLDSVARATHHPRAGRGSVRAGRAGRTDPAPSGVRLRRRRARGSDPAGDGLSRRRSDAPLHRGRGDAAGRSGPARPRRRARQVRPGVPAPGTPGHHPAALGSHVGDRRLPLPGRSDRGHQPDPEGARRGDGALRGQGLGQRARHPVGLVDLRLPAPGHRGRADHRAVVRRLRGRAPPPTGGGRLDQLLRRSLAGPGALSRLPPARRRVHRGARERHGLQRRPQILQHRRRPLSDCGPRSGTESCSVQRRSA